MKNIKEIVLMCSQRPRWTLGVLALSLAASAQACSSAEPGAAPAKPGSGGATANTGGGGQTSGGSTTTAGTSGTGGSGGTYVEPPCPDCVEFGLETRPANTTCLAGAPPPTNYEWVPIWGDVNLGMGTKLVPHPDGNTLIVCEKNGIAKAVPKNPNATQAEVHDFLDLTSVIDTNAESGLLSLSFHPDFGTNGYVYAVYSAQGSLSTRIARFQSVDGGLSADVGTQQILKELTQVRGTHHGGDSNFGLDGYLYVSIGDNNTGDDHDDWTAADPLELYGKILRLDVDSESPYGIPADNPFADGVTGAPEVYAYGMRNPWRFSFDQLTGELWLGETGEEFGGNVGDDGQANPHEEVDVVVKGGNYGWPFFQGTMCYHDCDQEQGLPPVYEYDHNGGGAVIVGGFVYRGSAIPSLVGKYIFGDYEMGESWALDPETKTVESLGIGGRLPGFGQDLDGEIYVLREDGSVEMLQNSTDNAGEGGFPELLTQTGCVRPEDPTKPADGLIPFSVALPFWSDGVEKERFLAIPDGATIDVSTTDGDFTLPPGGVTMKNFKWQGKYFETRFFVRHDDGTYYGYSYEWNDEQTEATLVPAGGKPRSLPGLEWGYPSATQCFNCHSEAAGRSLGLETRQFNVPSTYAATGLKANQVDTLGHIGIFTAAPPALEPYAAIDNLAAPLDYRARSYLAANCSHCHREGGPARGNFASAQFDTPFAEMGVCNQAPDKGDLGVAGSFILTPGNHAASVMWLRMSQREANFMPPIASKVADANGATLLAEWIDSLQACP
ncbi:MAG TPA: PQQ-dependent sugar dehydrogenase [Polyangiaceae bacterium]|nr:PQQ-dependent sugar dehydrogenase [Polyangiaceae bacterium]